MDWLAFCFDLCSVVVGYGLAVAIEWSVHNFVFHRLGKRRGSFFGFHYKDHHRAVRRTRGGDPAFDGTRFAWNGYGREFWGVIGGMVLLAPLALVAPLCWVSAAVCGVHYHIVHMRSHRDPRWCQDHLRWHWDHHLGTNQDTNWGVTNQWFDCVMGTRRPWVSKQERSAVEDAPARPARAAS